MRKFGIDFTRSRTITYAIIYRFSNKFCMRLNNAIASTPIVSVEPEIDI